jgi:hypothetical protein
MTSTTVSPAQVRTSVYAAFLHGYGCPSDGGWGPDLGQPVHFAREGNVYRQRFARGLTLANVGNDPVRVRLDRPYHDLDGVLRTDIVLPPRSGDVLLDAVLTPRHRAGGWDA